MKIFGKFAMTVMAVKIFPLLLFACPIYAQDPFSNLVVDGKSWNFVMWPDGRSRTETFLGDTVINGHNCLKYGTVNVNGFDYECAMYQEGGRVFSIPIGSVESKLEFDFSLSMGDTVVWRNTNQFEVVSSDSVCARGHRLKRLFLKRIGQNEESEYSQNDIILSWVEGMGGGSGPVAGELGATGDYRRLVDCSYDGEILYDNNILGSDRYDRLLLTYNPVWQFPSATGDQTVTATRMGISYPSPMQFVYAAVTIDEEGAFENKLELRESDGKVYATEASYIQYVSNAYPWLGENVYMKRGPWSLDVVLYDFNLSIGDSYPCRDGSIVTDVSSITTHDSVERKVLFLSNGLILVEGVGCVNSPLGPFAYQNYPCDMEEEEIQDGQWLKSLSKYDMIIFDKEDVNTLGIKNMPEDSAFLNGHLSRRSTTLYDLTGCRLSSPPSQGIYIRNGKKYVVK